MNAHGETITHTFCLAASTADEDRADRAKMKHLKRCIEQEGQGAVLHVEDATRCRDRWRIPVTFNCELLRLEFAHFAAVKRMGANFVVEENFTDDQLNAFFIEFKRSRLRGWAAMSRAHRVLCIGGAVVWLGSAAAATLHVIPYFLL